VSEIAVTIIEPGGDRRSAQLLDDRLSVRDALRVLVERLRLPRVASYRLLAAKERNRSLSPASALVEAGVRAGDVLRLEVERDGILRKLLDEMYEQAEEWSRTASLSSPRRSSRRSGASTRTTRTGTRCAPGSRRAARVRGLRPSR
jgi:hypothetical protein